MKHVLQVVVAPDPQSSAERLITGEEALQHLLKEVEAKVLGGSVVGMQSLKIFDAFRWLMTAAETEKHRTWVKAALTKAGSADAPKPAEGVSSECAKTTAKRVKQEQDMATATMALFKRKQARNA